MFAFKCLWAVIAACVCATLAGASSRSSPPPGRIVYSAATGPLGSNSYSLFTAAADGRGVRQITTNPFGEDGDPRWSPDGTQVAFTRTASNQFDTSVWVVNANGTNAHPVSGELTYAHYPKWSPDGRWIAFQQQTSYDDDGMRNSTSYELWLVRPDGSSLRRSLGAGVPFDASVPFIMRGNAWAWSPDSKWIAFVHRNDQDTPTVNVLDLATEGTRRLTTGTYPVWSPDGTRIAFVDRCRIWLIPAKGGKRTLITPRPWSDTCVADLGWSPDGRWLAATDDNGIEFQPLVARYDGRKQHVARRIRPAAVRWPRDCKRLFFYPTPNNYSELPAAGWVVHGPRGLPRFARVSAPIDVNYQVDWRC
jgi:Tol biopolymer transport system component